MQCGGKGEPVLVSRRYGEGITLELDQVRNDIPVPSLHTHRYFPDLIYNELFFAADVEPPTDLELAHQDRHLFIEAKLRKKVILSTLELIQKFGGNTLPVEKQL